MKITVSGQKLSSSVSIAAIYVWVDEERFDDSEGWGMLTTNNARATDGREVQVAGTDVLRFYSSKTGSGR